MVKNKKGWIKVIEAFIAILLLMSLLFAILGNDQFKKNTGSVIEKKQVELLREIELNNSLRNEVLGIASLPLDSNETNFPTGLNSTLDKKFGNSNCLLKVCEIDVSCELGQEVSGEVYSKETFIVGNNTVYDPRRVKIFCYEN